MNPYVKVKMGFKMDKECTCCHNIYPYTREFFYKKKKPNGDYGLTADCKKCIYLKTRLWRKQHKDCVKSSNQRYWSSDKGKTIRRKWDQKVYKENRTYMIEKNKRFYCTESGKELIRKRNSRRKNMGYLSLINNPFPKDIKVEWHHINDMFTIPIPIETHKSCYYGSDVELHRKKCNQLIFFKWL